jgi:hypothetical protein
MKGYFARLNPLERRFVVGVGLVLFVIINLFWVRPHFSDWSKTKTRLAKARQTLSLYEDAISQMKTYEVRVREMQSEGADVPPEEQSIRFLQAIQAQAAQSGVSITGSSRQTTRTNDQFFLEQHQSITVQSGEKQLVDFLYSLGSGNSMIRVRDLSLRPDQPRYMLNATIKLVASYQKTPASRTSGSAASATPASRTAAASSPPKAATTQPSTK